jgi:hypothetical protein
MPMRRCRTRSPNSGDVRVLGDADRAFVWLNRAVDHDAGIQWVRGDPLLRGITADPRYAARHDETRVTFRRGSNTVDPETRLRCSEEILAYDETRPCRPRRVPASCLGASVRGRQANERSRAAELVCAAASHKSARLWFTDRAANRGTDAATRAQARTDEAVRPDDDARFPPHGERCRAEGPGLAARYAKSRNTASARFTPTSTSSSSRPIVRPILVRPTVCGLSTIS